MKIFKYLNTGILILTLSNYSLFGQNIVNRMDSTFNDQFQNELLMGNILVAEHEKIIYQKSWGYQNIEQTLPNNLASVFALASITKQFTSTAILQLKEKGKLQLDDKLTKYLPDFPFSDITIRQLLGQTSGLPEYELFDSLIEKDPTRIFTNRDIIPALKIWGSGLYFKPGESWRYSSINYCLLALLVEKLSGQKLQTYLNQHIFKPAGMIHTYIENYNIRYPNPNRTVNYEYSTYYASHMINVDSIPTYRKMIYNLGGFYGQGGLSSTTEDMLQFDNAFFSGKLISSTGVDEVLSPVKLNNGKEAEAYGFSNLGSSSYGLGWFILKDSTKGKIVWHDGSRPGISSVHLHNIKTNQTVIILENTPEDGNASAICAYHILNHERFINPQIFLIQIYGQTLVKKGSDAAAAVLNYLRQDSLYKMPYDFMWLNLGYQLSEKNEYLPLSLEVFKMASLIFPDAWYISQGYAYVLEKAGEREEAILMYKKCIAQNPQNEFAKRKLIDIESK